MRVTGTLGDDGVSRRGRRRRPGAVGTSMGPGVRVPGCGVADAAASRGTVAGTGDTGSGAMCGVVTSVVRCRRSGGGGAAARAVALVPVTQAAGNVPLDGGTTSRRTSRYGTPCRSARH
ncbi:hypothetical protein GCM10027160_48520 [Streptomyces calidiresistens]